MLIHSFMIVFCFQQISHENGKPFGLLKSSIEWWPKGSASHHPIYLFHFGTRLASAISWKLHIFQVVTRFSFATLDCQSLESYKLIIRISVPHLFVRYYSEELWLNLGYYKSVIFVQIFHGQYSHWDLHLEL